MFRLVNSEESFGHITALLRFGSARKLKSWRQRASHVKLDCDPQLKMSASLT